MFWLIVRADEVLMPYRFCANGSKKIEKNCVFVCVKGGSFDGHTKAAEALEAFLQRPLITPSGVISEQKPHLAPGLYKKHYSPQTPLYLVKNLADYIPPPCYKEIFEERAAHIFLFPPSRPLREGECVLSPNSDLNEAASHLFDCL